MKGKPHKPDFIEVRVQEVVRRIKRKAIEHPNAPPSKIFQEEVSQMNDNEVIANIPQRNDIMRTISRIENRHRRVNPLNLEELNVVPPYTKTLDGQPTVLPI